MIAPAIMDIVEAISKARSGVSSPVFTLEDVELSFLFVDEVLSFFPASICMTDLCPACRRLPSASFPRRL